MEEDPHLRRLTIEHTKLINLDRRSRGRIKIDPVEVVPGMPPVKYIITFKCKGIASITDDKEPVAGDEHQVSMYITREFPRKEPFLLWLTPIWHPNVGHVEPRHVCINRDKNFFSTKGLDDFVLMLGEMVQYKLYHARPVDPLPYDREVADWVLNYAEPRDIVRPDKPFDPTPLASGYEIRGGEGKDVPRAAAPAVKAAPPTPPPVKREGIILGAGRSLPRTHAPAAGLIRKPGLMLGAKHRT